MSRISISSRRARLLPVLVSLVTLSLLMALPGQSRADEPAIPQAPVLPVVADDETLPFTLEGGGDIQIAVLTEGEAAGDAEWATASSLDLAPYLNEDIRILARAAGVTDPDLYFDATYQVRDTYPPGIGLGTDENPEATVPSAAISSYTTGWKDLVQGPNIGPNWMRPATNPEPLDDDGGMLNPLGDEGRMTFLFATTAYDGPGYDFIMFENGFRVNGTTVDFLELGYVEVSSNGTDFVRFDSASRRSTPVGPYEGQSADEIGGLGGRDLNNYGVTGGTPFDLAALKNKPEVRSGLVDLDAISEIRVVDIPGDGNHFDSFGRPIYDPFPSYDSGGYDATGAALIHQNGTTLTQVKGSATSHTSAKVTAKVSPGLGGDQEVRLEWSASQDHADAEVKESTTVNASDGNSNVEFEVTGLPEGADFWYRLVSEGTGGAEASTGWKAYSTSRSATFSLKGIYHDETDIAVEITADPGTEGDQELALEYRDPTDDDAFTRLPAETVAGDAGTIDVLLRANGMTPSQAYALQVVAIDSEGDERVVWSNGWYTLLDPSQPVHWEAAVSDMIGQTAKFTAYLEFGSYGPSDVWLEYTDKGDHSQAKATAPIHVDAQDYFTIPLDGLKPNRTYWVRSVASSTIFEKETTSEWVEFQTPALSYSLGAPSLGEVTHDTARFTVPVDPGDFTREVKVEYRIKNLGQRQSTPTQVVAAGGEEEDLAFEATGLKGGTTYEWRALSTVANFDETTDWQDLTTLEAPEPPDPTCETDLALCPDPDPTCETDPSLCPDQPEGRAKLRFTRIKVQPNAIKPRRGAWVVIRVKNVGSAPASKVKVCVRGDKRIKAGGCRVAKRLKAGSAKRFRLRVKARPNAKAGRGRIRIVLKADGLGAKSKAKPVRVKRTTRR